MHTIVLKDDLLNFFSIKKTPLSSHHEAFLNGLSIIFLNPLPQ